MTEIFGRRYSLIIGRLSKSLTATVPRYLATPEIIKNSIGNPTASGDIVAFDYRTEPDSFIKITDLSIKSDIVYTKATTNKGGTQNNSIDLHNLSKDTKARIREDDLVFLKAGYDQDIVDGDEESLPLVFVGQVNRVESGREGTGTNITRLVCGDNVIPKKTIKVSESWTPSTNLSTVVTDLLDIAAKNGIPTGKVFGMADQGTPLSERIYTYGYSVSGNLFDELQKICNSIDYIFYTSLGKIFIEPRGDRGSGEIYDFLILDTQSLKKPIEYLSDGSNPQGNESRSGIKITTYLNGRVTPEKFITIEDVDKEFAGTYSIKSIKHILDFEGEVWDTVIDCARVLGNG